MSEVLYRGKTFKNGGWIYGSLLVYPDGARFICCPNEKDAKDADVLDSYLVIPETIGRYTGLTDKNGVKIFEGDIVDLFGSRGEIVYECGAFGINFKPYVNWNLIEARIPIVTGERNELQFCYNDNFISLWELYWNFEQENDRLNILEIVGNVHDNPELLDDTRGSGNASKL